MNFVDETHFEIHFIQKKKEIHFITQASGID